MKTQRFIAIVLCLIVLIFSMTSCYGYNSIMRKHLSDETNYNSYHGTIREIFYLDEDYKKVILLPSDEIPECKVYFSLTFEDYDAVCTFLGSQPNPEWSLDTFEFAFEVTAENNRILKENGFYDIISMDTPVEITTSSFIYMDAIFFFIASVSYNETVYLHFEDGITGIIEFINDHKSLL